MNDFYSKIREYYDYIFPLSSKQVEFVQRNFVKGANLLEVGCANGKLTNALSDFDMTGIDLEDEFIDIARERYPSVNYLQLNMLEVNSLPHKFDGVICFGNTLVHISNKEVEVFISEAYELINEGGKILIQIVNYDKIIGEKLGGLPLLDNEQIKFERIYEHGEHFIFRAKLSVKSEGVELESKVELFPLMKKDLIGMLQQSGFNDIEIFGSFDGDEYSKKSMPLILKASK